MKNTTIFKAFAVIAVMLLCSCSATDSRQPTISESPVIPTVSTDSNVSQTAVSVTENDTTTSSAVTVSKSEEENMIYAHIGGNVLPIELCDNSSTDAFREFVNNGLTIEMHDYGGFEKVGQLDVTLPRNDEQISVSAGDVILYQGNSVTIYYDTNSWNFTRLGKVKGLTENEIKDILSAGDEGNIEVTFSAEA